VVASYPRPSNAEFVYPNRFSMCFYRNRLLQKTLCAYSLLGGLRALLYVLLADLRRRIQSLLVGCVW
jgi:hypothetical protein